MIGIPQLDRLDSETMLDILEGKTRIEVLDPKKSIQFITSEIPEPQQIDGRFLPQETIKTLLKMELELRMGWAYVAEKIHEYDISLLQKSKESKS